MSEKHDDTVTELHDGETTGEALAAVRAIARDLRAHRITADMHDGDRIDPASVRAILDEAADRIYAATKFVWEASWCERERLRLLVERLAQRVMNARLASPNPGGEDSLLREAQYEIEGTPYAVIANWINRHIDEGKTAVVEFRLGYQKNAPRMAFILDGLLGPAPRTSVVPAFTSHPEWGEPICKYWTIRPGERVELVEEPEATP